MSRASLLFMTPLRHWLSFRRCASFHQSQMDVHEKVRSKLTELNFTLNWVQFVAFTTEDSEKLKAQKQWCLSCTSWLIQMDGDFLFLQTSMNENVLFNCVRCVNGVVVADNWFHHISGHRSSAGRSGRVMLLRDLTEPSLLWDGKKMTRNYNITTYLWGEYF